MNLTVTLHKNQNQIYYIFKRKKAKQNVSSVVVQRVNLPPGMDADFPNEYWVESWLLHSIPAPCYCAPKSRRRQPKALGSCHQHGKLGLNSGLLVSSKFSPSGCDHLRSESGNIRYLSLFLSLCVCLSLLLSVILSLK